MAETTLWDGKTPTRKRFMSRTITWDTDFPSNPIIDQLFFKTSADIGFYRWDGNNWIVQLFDEDATIANILAVI